MKHSTVAESDFTEYWVLIKWSAMVAAVAWVLVYRLSEEAARIPDFVYVNF